MPTILQPSRPVQRRLDIKLEISAPLMDLGAVRGALDCDQDDVLSLISDCRLAYAFNIGVEVSARKEIRVLTKSVRGYQTTGNWCGLQERPIDEIIGWILAREHKPFILGKRLRSLFVCSSELIIDLCRSGCLRTVTTKDAWHRGRNGTPAIARDSVVAFLKARRM